MNATDTQYSVMQSGIDSDRFGVPIARAALSQPGSVRPVLDFCAEHQIRMVIARCPMTALPAAQALEQAGCLLMDTLVYYQLALDKARLPSDPERALIRPIRRPDDVAGVERTARASFASYGGHYHADPRLDRALSDEAYVSWAVRSAQEPGVADEVLVAELNGSVVGFLTLRLNTPQESEGVLNAVAPEAAGVKIYRSLMVHAIGWSKQHGADHMIISTQLTNLAVQKVWVRLGFELDHAFYTFHKWFDE